MKPSRLLPFIIILAILGGLIYARTSKVEPPSLVTQSQLQKLVPQDLSADTLNRFELYAAGKDTEKVVVRKVNDAWKVGQGFDAPADTEKVNTYIETLLGLQGELRARDVSEAGLSDYQLDDNQAFRVQAFKAEDTEPALDILVGKAPNPNTVFLRQPGNGNVYVEAANPRSTAGLNSPDMSESPTTKHWMDLAIMDVAADTITSIELNTPDKALTFEKQEIPAPTPPAEEGAEPQPAPAPTFEWKLTKGGLSPTFNQAGLDKILNRMKNMAAANIVVPAKKAEYGLQPPAFTLTMNTTDNEKPIRIQVGRPDDSDNAYLHLPDKEEDIVYSIVKYNFEQLFPQGSDLFELTGITLEKDAINEIALNQAEGNIALRKDGDQWTVTEPALGLATQNSAVTTLINAITAWTPNDYVDVAPDSWKVERSLTVKAGDTTHQLHIGPRSPSGLGTYARLDNEAQTLLLNDTDLTKLFVTPRDVMQLTVLNFDETKVKSIHASLDDKMIIVEKSEDGWILSPVINPVEADKNAVLDLLSTLVEFQASDILAETPIDIGANEYLMVAVSMDDDSGFAMNVDAASDGGVHKLGITGKPSVFTANSAAIQTLVDAIQALVPEAPATEQE